MTLLCGIPSSDFRGMPHHMQYSARGLGTAMSPEFFVTKIMLLILPDWKVRQIRKITVPIKQIIRWLLFDQPDWETRHFRFKTLNLENSEFTTARNSVVEGDIVASNSTLKLGATFRCSLICMMASISPVMVLASARTFVKDAQQMMAVAAIQAKLHCKKAPRWTSTTGSLAVLKPMTVR